MLFIESMVGLVLFMIVMLFFIVMFAGIMFYPPWWYWRESHTTVTIVQQQPTHLPTPTPPSIQYHIHLNQPVGQPLPAPQSLPVHRPGPETLEGEYQEIGTPRLQALPAPTGEDEFMRLQRALGTPRTTRQLPHRRG